MIIRASKLLEHCTKPKQIILLIFLTLFVFLLYLYFLRWQNNDSVHLWNYKQYDINAFKQIQFKGEKIVHLDLKGAPPKVEYFKRFFPLLSKLGATGILIEYEDMFPYKGSLVNISATNAYSLEDIKVILKLAEMSQLSVIPLVQTFGHMEFILKLKEFEHLRELFEYPQVICPTHNNALDVIMDMISQILEAHPEITKLHIGSDEVWYLGVCSRCIDVMNKNDWSKNRLFLEHISAIVNGIHKKHPHLKILMWDDKFRSMSLEELNSSGIKSLVELVVWKYDRNVYEELGPNLWDTYASVFSKIWIASAYKGATGSNQYLTDVTHHVENHKSWMKIVSDYQHKVKFEGIFLTGWQRYDHFAILCELLPVGIPSLAMDFQVLKGSNALPFSPSNEVGRILNCEQPYSLVASTFGVPNCGYPGGNVLDLILKFHSLKEDYLRMINTAFIKGWMTDYNIKYGFSNPQYVESGTSLISSLRLEINRLETDLFYAMQEIYDNYTINEWTETFIKPLAVQIENLWEAKIKLLSKTHWSKRPYELDNEL